MNKLENKIYYALCSLHEFLVCYCGRIGGAIANILFLYINYQDEKHSTFEDVPPLRLLDGLLVEHDLSFSVFCDKLGIKSTKEDVFKNKDNAIKIARYFSLVDDAFI